MREAPESMKTYAKVEWTAEDVQTLRPEMSQADAEEFLRANGKYIQDRLIEFGWEVIETLLRYESK